MLDEARNVVSYSLGMQYMNVVTIERYLMVCL